MLTESIICFIKISSTWVYPIHVLVYIKNDHKNRNNVWFDQVFKIYQQEIYHKRNSKQYDKFLKDLILTRLACERFRMLGWTFTIHFVYFLNILAEYQPLLTCYLKLFTNFESPSWIVMSIIPCFDCFRHRNYWY